MIAVNVHGPSLPHVDLKSGIMKHFEHHSVAPTAPALGKGAVLSGTHSRLPRPTPDLSCRAQ